MPNPGAYSKGEGDCDLWIGDPHFECKRAETNQPQTTGSEARDCIMPKYLGTGTSAQISKATLPEAKQFNDV